MQELTTLDRMLKQYARKRTTKNGTFYRCKKGLWAVSCTDPWAAKVEAAHYLSQYLEEYSVSTDTK